MGDPYCDRKGQSEMIVVRASSRRLATALARCGADVRQPGRVALATGGEVIFHATLCVFVWIITNEKGQRRMKIT